MSKVEGKSFCATISDIKVFEGGEGEERRCANVDIEGDPYGGVFPLYHTRFKVGDKLVVTPLQDIHPTSRGVTVTYRIRKIRIKSE